MDGNDDAAEELQREMIELRRQLDQERWLRMMLEERTRVLETQLYPEHLRHLAAHVQAQMHKKDDSVVVVRYLYLFTRERELLIFKNSMLECIH